MSQGKKADRLSPKADDWRKKLKSKRQKKQKNKTIKITKQQ